MDRAKPVRKERPNLNVLYLAIAAATLLRLYKLGGQSLWGDEALTLLHYTAGNSIVEAWHRIWSSGGHPPFYFLTVFYWVKLGHSEFMLRFPSLVFGVASIPVMYALANRLYGRGTASVSAWVVALSPIHIWYSQEARMYTLQILLALISTLFLVKAWQERRSRDHALFTVFAILGLFTQMATALFVAGQGVFALVVHARNRRILAVWVGLFVLIGLAFTPWVLAFTKDNTADGGSPSVGYERQASIFDSPYAFYTFTVGYSMGPSTAELHQTSAARALTMHWPAILIPAIVFGALTMLGLSRAWKANGGTLKLLASLLIVPALLAAAGSHLPGFPLNPRYILPAVVPYWIVLALGVQACSGRRILSIIPAAALVITGLSLHNHFYEPDYMKQDMRSATNLVNRQAQKGDVVIISSVELGGPFIYYYRRPGVPYFGYPPSGGYVDRSRLGPDVRRLVAGKDRAWLVLGRTWSSDPDGLIRRRFDSLSSLIEHHEYQGVTVLCYDLRHPTLTPTNR